MTKHRAIFIEATVAAVAVAFLIYLLRPILLLGESTIGHDNILWGYPVFQFFAENILNGNFLLWNPFTHSGEPFYPLLTQLRLLDPITYITIWGGHFITQDLVTLFNWDSVIRGLLMAFGIYIVFRPWAKHLLIKLSLIPILLYSSFILILAQSNGIFGQFTWIPFIAFFLLRIVYYRDYRWRNWFALAGFVGINWQGYMFTGTWVFLLFIALGFVIFRRDLLINLFKTQKIIPKLIVLAVIICAMALPSVALILERDEYVYPPRMLDIPYQGQPPMFGPLQYESGPEGLISGALRMPYDIIRFTGTFSTAWDYIQAISPDGNFFTHGPEGNLWGKPSEAFMYLGLLPWAIAILGLVAGSHDLKRIWLLLAAGFGLVMLGPAGGLHWLLYQIYPPLWFVRHTHTFVLFFLFSVLYFYVLGCNHLLTSWRRLFPKEQESKWLFGHLIRNNKLRMAIASLLFSGCFIFLVYRMTQLVYPQTNYLFLLIGGIFAMGWLLRNDMGKAGLFGSLILSSIIVVLILSPNTQEFVVRTLVFLGLPLLLFLVIRALRSVDKTLLVLVSVLCLVVLTVDLIRNFESCSWLYHWDRPGACLNVNTTPQKPQFLENRLAYPVYYKMPYGQSMRYLSVVYRQPFALSTVMEAALARATPFSGLTNGSFESWAPSPDGLSLPEQWVYYQDGTGGSVERCTAEDEVKDGSTSVRLKPSSAGNSFIRFESSEVERLRGHYVGFSVWVKSQNKVPYAIQVDIQDGTEVIVASYGNSGLWERIEVKKSIDVNAERVIVTCNVKASADEVAYFDDASIVASQVKPASMEFALNSKRWSSLLLPRKYFDLIHSGISPPVLEEMFAVGKPMFQFKQGLLEIEDEHIPAYLEQLGEDKAVKLLEETVIVAGPVLANLSDSGGARKNNFKYSISKYDYNSLQMTVSTEADGILYWADGYDKDWHAFIGGKEVPVYRANINFKAIFLPQGENDVSFVYKPFLFKLALFFFFGLQIVCLLGFIRDSWFDVK